MLILPEEVSSFEMNSFSFVSSTDCAHPFVTNFVTLLGLRHATELLPSLITLNFPESQTTLSLEIPILVCFFGGITSAYASFTDVMVTVRRIVIREMAKKIVFMNYSYLCSIYDIGFDILSVIPVLHCLLLIGRGFLASLPIRTGDCSNVCPLFF